MEDEVLRGSINPGETASYITSNETTPLQRERSGDESFRYIIIIFSVITLVITIALGISISQENKEVGLMSEVVSDVSICSDVGREIIKSGGNAVDASVAITLCLGVTLPHLTGIGGNGLILIYNHKTLKPVLCLDSWTPGSVSPLPKLLVALYFAHDSFGKKPWSSLVEPSIKIAREGFEVSESLLQSRGHLGEKASSRLSSWLASLSLRHNITSPRLSSLLTEIQTHGPSVLYEGAHGEELEGHYGKGRITPEALRLDESHCMVKTAGGYNLVASGAESGAPFFFDILTSANLTQPGLDVVPHLIDFLRGKKEMSWLLPSGVVVGAADDQDLYVSIVSGLGPVLGSQNMSQNDFIFGSNIDLRSFQKMGSIGTALIATDASSRCKRRIITGGVDVRDLVGVSAALLWGGEDTQTAVEGGRARFTSEGPLAEADHAPSLPFALPPAPRPYPAINVIEKLFDSPLSFPDSRGGI